MHGDTRTSNSFHRTCQPPANWILLIVCVAGFAAGCGGDSDGGSSSAPLESESSASAPRQIAVKPPPPPPPSPPPAPPPPTPTTTGTPSGWDYNLTHRCIKSPHPTLANYYEDLTDCPEAGRNWTVAVESEASLGASCPGPANQSFPINAPGSPVSLSWSPHVDEWGRSNKKVTLATDFVAVTHPCGAGYWTWFVLSEHVNHGGGPLPRPDRFFSDMALKYQDYVALNKDGTRRGATRCLLGWQGWWDGRAHMVEINIASNGWGDGHPDPDIVKTVSSAAYEYVLMNGSAMGVQIPRGVETRVQTDWLPIVSGLLSRGLLTAPAGGWPNTAMQAFYLGTEVRNIANGNAARANLDITNLRFEEINR